LDTDDLQPAAAVARHLRDLDLVDEAAVVRRVDRTAGLALIIVDLAVFVPYLTVALNDADFPDIE
jgi:hypothetical protein